MKLSSGGALYMAGIFSDPTTFGAHRLVPSTGEGGSSVPGAFLLMQP
jgi:hypothetical protein